MITGYYAGILAVMLAVLILQVVRCRWKYKVGLGDGGIKELEQRIRIHGNFTETVPLLLIVLFLLEQNDVGMIWLHVYGIIIVTGRVLHMIGISRSPTVSLGRTAGTVLTNLLLIAGGVTLVLQFILHMYD